MNKIIGVTNGTGEAKCVVDHVENALLGLTPSVEVVFADHPLADLLGEIPVLNSCVAIRNAILHPELQQGLFETWQVKPGPWKSSFFALFNGTDFSDWLEVGFSTRFMTGNVGPVVGFAQGAGLRAEGVLDGVRGMDKVQRTLRDIGYRGQVLLYVNELFELTDVRFGHFYAHWGIFSELCKVSNGEMISFLLGDMPGCELYDSVCVANLVSMMPFPSLSIQTQAIHAPKNAEKHLWRVPRGLGETVLITVHGDTVHEGRRRIRRTLDNMLQGNPDLQYRTDYGYGLGFTLARERYVKLCERKVTKEGG